MAFPEDGVLFGTSPGFVTGDTLGQSQYDFRYTVFPTNIGMDQVGHYMVININVPTTGIKTNGLAAGTPAGAFGGLFTPINQVSKLDVLRFGTNVTGGQQAAAFAIPQNTVRIAESIALYMPTPLVWNEHNLYEEISLTALAGKVGVGAATFISNVVAAATAGVGGILAAGLEKLVNGAGETIGVISGIMGNPINPAVEIIFANRPQRQFVFEWLFAPRNQAESDAVKAIIKTIRFHGAPELNGFTGGLTWIPPATFDITFFDKGVENTNILRINTCVLERAEVDYAPTGIYSTFRNGHPVTVRFSLAFRELEPIHKQRVLQGF